MKASLAEAPREGEPKRLEGECRIYLRHSWQFPKSTPQDIEQNTKS